MNTRVNRLSDSELQKLRDREESFNLGCAGAMKSLYRLQQWTPAQIHERIPGMAASTWHSYAQQNYKSRRLLHVMAAYSWASQVTMNAIYRGSDVELYWVGVDAEMASTLIYAALLTPLQFNFLVSQIQEVQRVHGLRSSCVIRRLEVLNEYSAEDFLMPMPLNLDDFKHDYYQSIALVLREFRDENQLTLPDTASVLGLTADKYAKIEDPFIPANIPVYCVMRLMAGFQLTNPPDFTKKMSVYPGFSTARVVQSLRERILIDSMSYIPLFLREKIKTIAYSLMMINK